MAAAKMRAQVLERVRHYEYKEVPVPEIGADEVLVKVKYCGICGSDWGSYTGKYADEVECIPLITGHEVFGTIEEKGADVPDSIKIGDRVTYDICVTCGTCYHCRIGEPLLCSNFRQIGIHMDGGFAEFVKVPWKNIYHVPDEVSDEQAAFVEPLTACLNASRKMDSVISRSVVIIGAGLGLMHGQLAKLRGAAPVIVVDHHPDRLDIALKTCADYVINSDEEDPVEAVMRITGGIGADYVLEAVGHSGTYEMAFRMLRKGGKLEAFGICAEDDLASLPAVEFVTSEKKISGSCAGIGYDWADALNLIRYGRVDPMPLISAIVPLEDLEATVNEIQKNRKLIKVLVSPQIHERINFYQE